MFPSLSKKKSIGRHQDQSLLSKFSKDLSDFKIPEKSRGSKIIQDQAKVRRNRTEPDVDVMLREYKDEIQHMKEIMAQKNLERSLMIEDRLRRISRLSLEANTRPVENTKPSINYISLTPPSYSMPVQPPAPPVILMNPYNLAPPPMPYYNYESPKSSIDSSEYQQKKSLSEYKQKPKKKSNRYNNDTQSSISDYQSVRGSEKLSKAPQKSIKDINDLKDIKDIKNPSESFLSVDPGMGSQNMPSRYKDMRQKSKQKKASVVFKKPTQKLLRKFKIAALTVFFSLMLAKYSKNIKKVRNAMFERFESKRFNVEMTMMQKYVVKKCKPFFVYFANHKKLDLTLDSEQTDRMQQEKAQTVKKLINMLIEGLLKIQISDTNDPATNPIEVIHLFCKHGSFVNKMMTEEELDLTAFSLENQYLRMERNTEISQIINFICNKILLYNTILHPEKVDNQLFPPTDQLVRKNFYFLGSIWYEICLEVQDEYLCRIPASYDLGNWRQYRDRLNIQPAKSLAVNGQVHSEDELISGLLGKKKIQEVFGKNFWRKEKVNLKNALESIHKTIVEFHKQVKSNIKF